MSKVIYLLITIILSLILVSCEDNLSSPVIDSFQGIVIVNSDGTNQIRVENTEYALHPHLIPESDKILFIENDSYYTIKEDGSEKTRLTTGLDIYEGEEPCMSQDGQQIYFSAKSSESQYYTIYKYSFYEGTVELVRSHPGFNCYNIDLSDDDNHLLVSEYGVDNSIVVEIDLQVMDVDVLLNDQFGYEAYVHAVYGLDDKVYYLGYSDSFYSLNFLLKESNENTILKTNVGPPLEISPNREILVFDFGQALHYFISENELIEVTYVYDFDISNEGLVYNESNSNLFKLDFNNNEVIELERNALDPSYSQQGNRIVYIKELYATKRNKKKSDLERT